MENINVVSIQVVKERAHKYTFSRVTRPSDAYLILRDFIGMADREHFVVALLNTKNYVNALNVVSIGTINETLVHPREVFKPAILANSVSIILAHNHPSGIPDPSQEDILMTNKLIEAGKLLGIPIQDHIIVCDEKYFSFKEKGLM